MLTPQNAARLLTIYEDMAVAARHNDWDRLAELEPQAAAVRAADDSTPPGAAALPEDSARALAAVIRRIQVLDAEIRSHAEPARDAARKLLSGAVRDNNVRKAYGAVGP
ncbi:flagellar protein FliT [Pseudothauera rhizosphaerae]|uniref:Flagellar protein FliT n=1 Tax=Pseudothauera rhizosphaerae TaxID=2565932 RepID=A0A4S4AWY3_9RHOO|nr:flagellar protein FliT [Pseudothauera rhizosphaerae]THF64153.1 flagellar protein FliT [Pseudothauera rhizosphaerae]